MREYARIVSVLLYLVLIFFSVLFVLFQVKLLFDIVVYQLIDIIAFWFICLNVRVAPRTLLLFYFLLHSSIYSIRQHCQSFDIGYSIFASLPSKTCLPDRSFFMLWGNVAQILLQSRLETIHRRSRIKCGMTVRCGMHKVQCPTSPRFHRVNSRAH